MEPNINSIPCYYFRFNDDGLIEYANEQLSGLFGLSADELKGKQLNQLLTLSSRIFFHTHWLPMLHMQEMVNELYITIKQGNNQTQPLLVNSQRKKTENGYVTDCIGIAISGRQKLEDELIAAKKAYDAALSANAQLTSAQDELNLHAEQLSRSFSVSERQNKELKQINKIVTHDLQEPMRKLLFFSEQLQGLLEGIPTPALKKIERLSGVIQTLKHTLAGLQQYVWITEMNVPFRDTDLNETLIAATAKIRERYGSEILKVNADILPTIAGNREQLFLLFSYILDNAVLFRSSGKQAVVNIRSTELVQNTLQNLKGRYQYNNYLRIDISDQGIGLDKDTNKRIFELFYKTADSKGSGLGLALSRKIVENHNGTITAEQNAASGATISITIPFKQKG